MNWICKLALLIVPINLIAVAIVRLESMHQASGDLMQRYFTNNTLLIVAHPDDETMFFGPLILNLLDSGKHLNILCLSDGGSDDLGQQRKREFKSVVDKLGPQAHLNIITDNHLLDGLDQHWDADDVAYHIDKYIRTNRNLKGPEGVVKTIVSFDSYGISGHDNHRSIFKSLQSIKKQHRDLKMYHLTSVNLVRKYISFLDILSTYIPRISFKKSPNVENNNVMVALNFSGYKRLRGLLSLHKSQMVWFRQLYMIFSRYMFINDFQTTLVV